MSNMNKMNNIKKVIKAVLPALMLVCLSQVSFAASTYEVKPGDTMSLILANEYSHDEILAIMADFKKQVPKFVLRAGSSVDVDGDEYLFHIAFDQDARVSRDGAGKAIVDVMKYEQEIMPTIVSGSITRNLFSSVAEIGEDAMLADQLARMYEWEFDFFTDIHYGDRFLVLLEKIFVNGRYVGYGRILAADFVVQGRHHKAFLYSDGKTSGYFDEKGMALERGFLRAPLSYSRISSRFSSARKHPVFGVTRPHYGVDYAAPRGTPVMTAATGVIDVRGYSKGNGNYVKVRHNGGYTTYYLHLNGFAKGIRNGVHVKQGDIIGYVGSTGYSTGNHLDYRINHNGKWLNPIDFVAESPKLTKTENIAEFMEISKTRELTMRQSYQYAGVTKPVLIP
jgi:murein DD-endopeptidase MepM/ murein hydrolase activator NlpD